MRANSSFFFTLITLAMSLASITEAQTPINTVPEGAVTYTVAATGVAQSSINYFSAPLANDPAYTGGVASIGASTISVADTLVNGTAGPWTANQFAPASGPYFVKFLTGAQAGRTIEVLSNTIDTLTLDTSDNTSQTVALNTTNFSVAANDNFEIFLGDTLGSLLGINTSQSPLVLTGGANSFVADTVSLFIPVLGRFQTYFFNTTAGAWQKSGSSVNADNTIVFPYTCFEIVRRPGQAALTFSVMGRVPEVTPLIKTSGNSSAIYESTGFPVDMTLGSLNLSNWTQGSSTFTADTLSVWNSVLSRFDTYYENNSVWQKVGSTANANNFVIPAGTTVLFVKRASVSGSTSYLSPAAPYSLN